MSTPTITVRTAGDVQTAATTRYLDREGIDYTAFPAGARTVSVVAFDGTERSWSGFRPEQLRQAVTDLEAVSA